MKPVKILNTLICIAIFAMAFTLPKIANSQCAALKTISYNLVIDGTGNDYHVINMPQFDSSKGSLVAVKITSVISLQYAFQLENNSHSAVDYGVEVGRNDYIGSPALPAPATNMNQILRHYGPYALGPSDGVKGSGPDYISVPPFSILNDYNDISDSLTTGLAGFLGSGNVEFDYSSTTYYNITGSYIFNYTASDTISFSVTYYYCDATAPTPPLISNLVAFDAKMQNNSSVNLSWETLNEQLHRTYTIQKSTDGTNFDDLTDIQSSDDSAIANYFYNYTISAKDKSEIYFRLKITDTTSSVQYSAVRSVKLQETSNTPIVPSVLTLYPNPSNTFINIVFNQPADSWQIDIVSSDGVILQRSLFANASMAQIGFIKKLPPAAYFIHALDLSLQKSYVLTFLVQ